MKKYFVLGCTLLSINMFAQQDFTKEVKKISEGLENIVRDNKDLLKKDLEKIDRDLDENNITKIQADSLREARTIFYAEIIEKESVKKENDLIELVNKKIDDAMDPEIINRKNWFSTDHSKIENRNQYALGLQLGHSALLSSNEQYPNAFHSKMISSFGIHLALKSRLSSGFSRWHAVYQLGWMYQGYRLNHNQILATENGNTTLVPFSNALDRNKWTMNSYQLSTFIEYDFGKKKKDEEGNIIWSGRKSVYAGVGGYIGLNQNPNVRLKYRENGNDYEAELKSDYEIEKFMYGVSGYIGYRNFKVQASYNLNSLFRQPFGDYNILNVGFVYEAL